MKDKGVTEQLFYLNEKASLNVHGRYDQYELCYRNQFREQTHKTNFRTERTGERIVRKVRRVLQ